VGLALGLAISGTPATAHVSGSVSHLVRHLKSTFFTKAQADRRYVNVGESATHAEQADVAASATNAQNAANAVNAQNAASATNAANAANAANADLLDGLDSPSFLRTGSAAGGRLSGAYPNPTIAPNSITGADVNEASLLDPVPFSTDSAKLGGLGPGAYKPTLVNFEAAGGTARTLVLGLGGLRLYAACGLDGDLRLDAESTEPNARVAVAWVSDGTADDTPFLNQTADLDPSEEFADLLGQGDNLAAGTLTYRGFGGSSAVTVTFLADEHPEGCSVGGTAIAAP
jgi:hypothetical protein